MDNPQATKGKGCVFYGCVSVIIAMILMVIAMYVGTRYMIRSFVGKYTDTAAIPIPTITVVSNEMESFRDRMEKFKMDLNAGKAKEPVVISARDLNLMILDLPELKSLKGSVFLDVTNDQLVGRISLPLDTLNSSFVKGRFLNGEASFNAIVTNGQLSVTLQSLKAKGVNIPAEAMLRLQGMNLAKDANTNPKGAELFSRFESITIRDGNVVVVPKTETK